MAEAGRVRDYILDGPGGTYRDAVAPPSQSNLQIMRVWGEIAEEDTFEYNQEISDAASNEKEYVEGGPGQAYQNDLIKYSFA